MIRFECVSCHQEMEAPESRAGQKEKCPHCGWHTTVPTLLPVLFSARDWCVIAGIVLCLAAIVSVVRTVFYSSIWEYERQTIAFEQLAQTMYLQAGVWFLALSLWAVAAFALAVVLGNKTHR